MVGGLGSPTSASLRRDSNPHHQDLMQDLHPANADTDQEHTSGKKFSIP